MFKKIVVGGLSSLTLSLGLVIGGQAQEMVSAKVVHPRQRLRNRTTRSLWPTLMRPGACRH